MAIKTIILLVSQRRMAISTLSLALEETPRGFIKLVLAALRRELKLLRLRLQQIKRKS